MKVDDMITRTRDWDAFRYEIHFYECLGFNLKYKWVNREQGAKLLADPKFQFELNCNHYNSFLFEFIVQIMLILAYSHISNGTKKVAKLTNPDQEWQNDIEWYWNKVEEDKQKQLAPEEEEEDAPLTIGTKTVLN